MTYYSSTQRFPKIYSISEIQLQLNNIPLPTTTDNYEVHNYTIQNRVCCLNSPSPCHIDIVTDQSNRRVGETCVDFNLTSLRFKESQTVGLTYTVCNAITHKYWINYKEKKGANVNASITLMNYRQEDSQTSCHEGLRHGADNVVFKAQVCLTQENSIVKFVTKKRGEVEFQEVCNVNIVQGCTYSQEEMCYCNHKDSTNTHHIVVNITADLDYSGANIRGVLISGTSHPIYSQKQRFPKIFKISEIKLTVNELYGPSLVDKPVVDTNVPELKACCRDSPLPCWTKVVSNDVVVASGAPCVAYNFSNHDNGTARLIVDVCNVMEYTIPVRFLQNSAILTASIKMDQIFIYITTLAAAIMLSISIVCAICYIKARSRRRRATINTSDTRNKGDNLPENEHIYAVVKESDFPIGTVRYINRPPIYTLSSDLPDTEPSLQWGRAATPRSKFAAPATKSRQTCVEGVDYITPSDVEDRDEVPILESH